MDDQLNLRTDIVGHNLDGASDVSMSSMSPIVESVVARSEVATPSPVETDIRTLTGQAIDQVAFVLKASHAHLTNSRETAIDWVIEIAGTEVPVTIDRLRRAYILLCYHQDAEAAHAAFLDEMARLEAKK